MRTVTIEEAQAKLPEIIDQLSQGEEMIISRDDTIVARIVGERPVTGWRREPGLCRGMLTIVSDDDEHLKDFTEYML